MLHELNAIVGIAYRDFVKFLRDRTRLIFAFIFPVIFIGVLGNSLQSNVSSAVGYSFIAYTFTGVLAQILFQATAQSLVLLNEERGEDLSQEVFVSPISRYSILLGRIAGGSMNALTQSVGVILFGLLMGVSFGGVQFLRMLVALPVICLLGGSFGIIILSNLRSNVGANQVFPLLLFPQFFLAGVFSPIQNLPLYLLIPSRLVPMTYAVDFLRGLYYWGQPEFEKVVLHHPLTDLAIIAVYIVIFLGIGTFLFVRNERNK